MPKRINKQDNPYIGCIEMAVSDGERDYSREELGEQQFYRILVRDGLSAMFHLHDIGMFNANIDGWGLKPDKP